MNPKATRLWSSILSAAFLGIPLWPATAEESAEVDAALEMGRAVMSERAQEVAELQHRILERQANAIKRLERVVTAYPNDPQAPTLQFRLAELLFAQERAAHLARFDDLESLEDDQLLPSYPRAKAAYWALLNQHPEAQEAAGALYGIAYCLQEEGDVDGALARYSELVSLFPDSPYTPETRMRMGEHYFDRNELEAAAESYEQVLAWPASSLYEEALYKLGWTHYRLSNYESAISVFTYLIDDASGEEVRGGMADEAKSYIAISFSEFGGVERLAGYLAEIGDRPYGPELLLSVGGLFRGSGDFGEAEDAFRRFVAGYPGHEEAPNAQRQLIEVLEMQEQDAAALEARASYAQLFGPGSAWADSWGSADEAESVREAAEEFHYSSAAELHRRGRESKNAEELQRAAYLYETFLQRFPESGKCLQVAMQRADAWLDLEAPLEAAGHYLEAAAIADSRQDAQASAADALYNAILVFDRAGAPEDPTVFGQFSATVERFGAEHPRDERLATVRMRRAEILFDNQDYQLAAQGFSAVAQSTAAAELISRAEEMAARSYFEAGQYAKAESWSAGLRNVPDAGALRLASVYKQAEALRAAGEASAAAVEFLRVVELDPQSVGADAALYDAATSWLSGGEQQQAARDFERLATRYPDSELANDALRQAAVIREAEGEYGQAATLLASLARRTVGTSEGDDAAYFSALYWEQAGATENARVAFATYFGQYVDRPDRHMDARLRELHLSEAAGASDKEVKKRLEGIVGAGENYRTKGNQVSHLILAEAEWKLTDLRFGSYRAYRIEEPLQKTTQRKERKMNDLLDGYLKAAEHGSAKWSVRSLTRIGEALEEFEGALLGAPLPADITEVEAALYTMELEDYVRPFEEQAAESYLAALDLAVEAELVDPYALRARARLGQLRPGQELPELPGDGPPVAKPLHAEEAELVLPSLSSLAPATRPGKGSLPEIEGPGLAIGPGMRWSLAGAGAAGGIATAALAAQGSGTGLIIGLGALSTGALAAAIWTPGQNNGQVGAKSNSDFSAPVTTDDCEKRGPTITLAPDLIGRGATLALIVPLR